MADQQMPLWEDQRGSLPFKFRKGDRVKVHGSGEITQIGVVVGGRYEGPAPPASGRHRIVYWVRRDDGHLFEADESRVVRTE